MLTFDPDQLSNNVSSKRNSVNINHVPL